MPKALVYYESQNFPNNITSKYKPFLFKSNSQECLFATYKNYTECLQMDLSLYNNETNIDKSLVKLIYFPDDSLYNSNEETQDEINHKVFYFFIVLCI